MKKNTNIDELIAKVLSGEASEREITQLKSWRLEADFNESYFKSVEKIFAVSGALKPEIDFNTDVAWEQVKQSIHENKNQSTPEKSIVPAFTATIFKIAAMVLLTAGMSYTAYKIFFPDSLVQKNTFIAINEINELSLPDSSRITLNKNSELEYLFDNNNRTTKLSGEAFFDLAEDKRPFILKAGSLTITDIGTSFNVKAPENSDSVIVIVKSGEVLLKTDGSKELKLIGGDQAIYIKQRDYFIKSTVADTNALAYKTKIFVFENTRMEVIVNKLNEVYGTSVKLSDSLKNCRLTATFKNESIESIIDVIAETLNIQVDSPDNEIILKGEGCE